MKKLLFVFVIFPLYFFGQESSPNKYMPQIYFYDDGTVEKKLLKYY